MGQLKRLIAQVLGFDGWEVVDWHWETSEGIRFTPISPFLVRRDEFDSRESASPGLPHELDFAAPLIDGARRGIGAEDDLQCHPAPERVDVVHPFESILVGSMLAGHRLGGQSLA